jgi:hypothetical protein
MHYVKFFVAQAILIALLVSGILGVEGAFNVYVVAVVILTMLHMFLWSDQIGMEVIMASIRKRKGAAPVPGWIRYSILGGQFLALVWFGHFITAVFMGFNLFTLMSRGEYLFVRGYAQYEDETAAESGVQERA